MNIYFKIRFLYELFKKWTFNNGIKYEIDSLKLGVRITNLNIHGIYKGAHTNKGTTKLFNLTELSKTFKLGCFIDL